MHVRDAATGLGTQDPEVFREVVEALRAETDAILCLTTSGIPGRNLPTARASRRWSCNRRWRASTRAPSRWTPASSSTSRSSSTPWQPKRSARDVKLELECFDLGMVETALRYHAEGKIPAPLHFQFVTGTRHGMPATAAALVAAVDLLPAGSTWSVIGVGRTQTPMAMIALAMGGHVRVGLEDDIFYRRGELATGNAQLVERAVRLAGELGRPVATPARARELLGLV